MKKPLFRLVPKEATDADVEAANIAQKRRGPNTFLSTTEARDKAWRSGALSPERAVALALHPDERVAMEMARNSNLHGGKWPYAKELDQVLIWRAVRDARSEGVVWTPLLDALSRRDWAKDDKRAEQLNGFKPRAEAKTQKALGYTKAKDPFLKLLGSDAWPGKEGYFLSIRKQLEEASLADRFEVKHFQSESFIKFVASLTKPEEWSEEVAAKWTKIKGRIGLDIFANTNLPLSARQGVLKQVARQVSNSESVNWELGTALAKQNLWTKEPLWSLAVAELGRWKFRSERTRQLWEWVVEDTGKLSAEQWEAIRPFFGHVASLDETYLLRHIFKDSRLVLDDIEEMFKRNRSGFLRSQIANSPAVNLPGVAERLAQSKRPRVGRTLAQKAAPETYGRIFKQMAKNHPTTALNSLDERQEDVAEFVNRKDMAPLLGNQDKEKRLQAVKLITKVGPKKPGTNI